MDHLLIKWYGKSFCIFGSTTQSKEIFVKDLC